MDRTGKILLAAIALGVWANAAIAVFQSKGAEAQRIDLRDIDNHLNTIEQLDLKVLEDMLVNIENGACPNPAICHP
jgi:hypothetical protein